MTADELGEKVSASVEAIVIESFSNIVGQFKQPYEVEAALGLLIGHLTTTFVDNFGPEATENLMKYLDKLVAATLNDEAK